VPTEATVLWKAKARLLTSLPSALLLIALSSVPSISVTPRESLLGEPVTIAIGDRPGSQVTVNLTSDRFGLTFKSTATYILPESGSLKADLSLLWLMMPSGPSGRPAKFTRDSDLDPRTYTVSVTADGVTASSTFIRRALDDSTVRRVVDQGTRVGTLFSAKDGSCRPGLVVLGGSEGGVPEEQAAVLASHGFATLALAYYNAPGLSKSLVNVPVELVQNGVRFLKTSAEVCKDRKVGVVGSSKGAELALVAGSLFPDIQAVAAISPSSVVFEGIGQAPEGGDSSSWTYQGHPLTYANGAVPAVVTDAITAEKRAGKRIAYMPEYAARLDGNTNKGAVIGVARIAGPILLVAGGDDQLWPSLPMANQIAASRNAMTPRYPDLQLSYPKAGHQIGIPYGFAKAELAHSSLDLGGTAAADEDASRDSWPKLIDFLTKIL
jgi:dienelactone hydrolase